MDMVVVDVPLQVTGDAAVDDGDGNRTQAGGRSPTRAMPVRLILFLLLAPLLAACVTGVPRTSQNDRLRFAIEPRFESSVILTDNGNLTEANRQEDIILGFSPALNLRRQGPRLDVSLDYSADYLVFLREGSTDLRHNLFGLVDLEIWKNHWNVAGRASLQQTFLDRTAGLSGSIGNQTDNRRLVQTYTAGSYFQGDLNDWLDINTNYEFTVQLSPADNLDDETLTTNFSDTTSHQLTHSVETGDRFNRLYLAGELSMRRVLRSLDVSNFRDDQALARIGYRVNRYFSIEGGAGWTINDLVLDGNQEDGFTWEMGFRWRPSRRTSIDASIGREGSREIVEVSLQTQPTRRTTFVASYVDQVQANTFEISDGVQDLTFSQDFGILTQSGLPASSIDPVFTLNDVDFRQKSASTTFQWSHRVDTYFLNATYEERIFDDGSGTSTTWGVSQGLRHLINRREEINLTSSFRRNEFEGSDRVDDNWRAGIEYKKTFSRYFIGAITYSYSYRDSTEQGGDLLENAVTFYLRATF